MLVQPLFSIIIATYNSDKTLIRCLNSVKEQTFANYELIIINGNSTDKTLDILKQFHNDITTYISEPDNGIYDAWNKGLKLAKGEWITFIGSDDVLYPNALADYNSYINTLNNSEIEFISSKLDLVNINDAYIKTLGKPWNWDQCRRQNVIAHPGSLHNKALFKKWGQFDTTYRICADLEFLLRPGNSMKAAFLDKPTVRMAQGGVSFNTSKLFAEHYRAALTTGKLDYFTAKYYYAVQILKSQIKKLIRNLNVDI